MAPGAEGTLRLDGLVSASRRSFWNHMMSIGGGPEIPKHRVTAPAIPMQNIGPPCATFAFAIFSWNLNAPLEPSYFPFTADNSAPKFDRGRTPCQFARPEQ